MDSRVEIGSMHKERQNINIMKLLFITGSSGVGKSTILPFLKNNLSNEFDVHDFDKKLTEEVAMNGKLLDNWRMETMKYWFDVARENLKSNKSTVVVGLIYPNEVKQLDQKILYNFCLLDVSDEKIQERLMNKRFSNSKKIVGLRRATGQTPEEFILENKYLMKKLRNEINEVDGKIIDTTADTPKQTANKLASWILKN